MAEANPASADARSASSHAAERVESSAADLRLGKNGADAIDLYDLSLDLECSGAVGLTSSRCGPTTRATRMRAKRDNDERSHEALLRPVNSTAAAWLRT
ncbi:MAG: hypothetical protein LC750_18705 [Actinobacteria bacterium]|nr:hypothetical protein [Actinomycetota bacterium]